MILKKNMDEILINKKTTINRCIKRIQDDFQDDFKSNYTKQDAVILNIERACQAAIDMGNRMIRIKNLGLPQSNRDTFLKLEKDGIISAELSKKLQSMAGFRNLAVHDYGSMNIDVIINIIENNLQDLVHFAELMVSQNEE
jgi:uncharacterized protein YutE (UPF0331/DUF86 family)